MHHFFFVLVEQVSARERYVSIIAHRPLVRFAVVGVVVSLAMSSSS